MAMTRSRSSERIMPVRPPESIETEITVISLKPPSSKLLITTGAPVPPPITTILDDLFVLAIGWLVGEDTQHLGRGFGGCELENCNTQCKN